MNIEEYMCRLPGIRRKYIPARQPAQFVKDGARALVLVLHLPDGFSH
jgi:hypothetical protein